MRFQPVEPEPQLVRDVRRALADGHPLSLLTLVSSLLAVIDPRRSNPFDRSRHDELDEMSRGELLDSFIDIDSPETSTLLAVIGTMSDDELERARIRHEVNVYRAIEVVDILGDSDNVILGIRFAAGQELSIVIYIDHNLGSIVKDAFIVTNPSTS